MPPSASQALADRQTLLKTIKASYHLALKHSQQGLVPFLHHVTIDSRPEPMPFRLKADPWQWDLMARLAPAVEAAAGLAQYDGPRCFWYTLPRGHDKTGAIGRTVNWALGFTRRRLSCIAAAGDKDQATILVDSMRQEANLNPWLGSRLNFHTYKVQGSHDSALYVLSADASSAYGNKSDIMVLDEVTHWAKRDLWDSILSGRNKRPECVLLVISNAGLLRSWQHEAIQAAQDSPHWHVFEAKEPLASWMDRARLESDARVLPRAVARRLVYNQWVDPAEGTGYVTREQVSGCAQLGRDLQLGYQFSGVQGVKYYAAVDYGIVRDRTALAVLHADGDVVVLDRLDVLQGSHQNPVQVSQVEDWITMINRAFHKPTVVLDPFQMESTYQKFQNQITIQKFEARGGKANYEMAVHLHSLIANKRLAWYPKAGNLLTDRYPQGHDLGEELCSLAVKPTTYGYRFDHEANEHDDRAVAVGMAALALAKAPKGRQIILSDKYF